MNPIVEAGAIGAGAAFLSSLLTGILTTSIARSRVLSNERMARRDFLNERQADTYVILCDQVTRIEAWANIAVDRAQGKESSLGAAELLTGDRWFDLQGRLRVFGSRPARDEFDMTMTAALKLHVLEEKAAHGQAATNEQAMALRQEIGVHAARVRTCVSAEVGPLWDVLSHGAWWNLIARRRAKRRADGLQAWVATVDRERQRSSED